jgi:hypothetical protein
MISALGKNDQKIHVAPSKGWVVVRMGNASGYTGIGGDQVPILFDDNMWKYLNELECGSSSVADNPIEKEISVSPNPGTDGWLVESRGNIQSLQLCDLQGRVLRSMAELETNSFWLDARDLQPGVFILKTRTEMGEFVDKIMKIN